jgi:hypothetical protein
LTFRNDFEGTPVGGKVAYATTAVENKGDSIAVTDELAASGRQCLKIVDVPGLQHNHNPHFNMYPSHGEGVSRCSFDLRIDAATNAYHEWREQTTPYRVGPSVAFRGGKLWVAGKAVMDLPVKDWFHVDVTAGLGAACTGKWHLKVTLPGQAPKELSDLPFGHADFRKLSWMVFVSDGQTGATWYLDNLELANE